MKRTFAALFLALGVTCALFPVEARQAAGGAFMPAFDYVISGNWTHSGTTAFTGVATMTAPVLSSPVISTIRNTGTLTLPSATGGVPVVLDCGATGSGNQTCAPVAATAATKVYAGSSTLSSNSAVITFPTAFAATSSYQCVADDITTRANPVQMLSTSAATATITNTTGASDVINWICVGY